MTQERLREIFIKKLAAEKMIYISKVTGIDVYTLSRFKNRRIDLYPHLAEKLEAYLKGELDG